EFIIPSIYTQKKQFYLKNDKTDWTFYENESVNFKRDINFPENIIIVDKVGICFRCGELQLLTKLTKKDWLGEFNIQREVHFGYEGVLDIACHYQGRDDLMDPIIRDIKKSFLEREDLRFAEKQRAEVYKQIGEDMHISYYELALKYGFDLGRFY
ncbi:MAG: hypothetical protein LBU73_06620, partial [Helicobacteraceae bacterium]|nr:hypothetical protein [Helicobacteraceae bacterium]